MGRFITTVIGASKAKIALLLLAGLMGAIAAGAAPAGSDNDVPRVVVKYSEASLGNEAGVADLYRRITVAARQVCPTAQVGDFLSQIVAKECQDAAVSRAIQQIDNSRLARLYAARSKNG